MTIRHFQSVNQKPSNGTGSAKPLHMPFFCRHCDDVATGKMYRVFSEEHGIVLLDMIVCRFCYEQAIQLGLDGEEIAIEGRSRQQLPVGCSSVDKSVRGH